jgi:RNA methyltransferase, TrmH family
VKSTNCRTLPRMGEHEPIRSRENRWFRRFREAIERHDDEIALEGPKQVRDAIDSGWTAIAVAVAHESITFESRGIPLVTFDRRLMKSLSETVATQGVIGLFRRPAADLADILADRTRIAVVLDGVQDPGNVGTIVRLAAAFDAAGVIVTEGTADPFGPKAVRATAGALVSVPVASARRKELVAALEHARLPLYVAAGEPDAGSGDLPSAAAAIAFGSEGGGVSDELRRHGRAVAITTSGRVESLNVAAAAAILLERAFSARR